MASEPTPNGSSLGNGHPDSPAEDLSELKELLLGPERRRLDEAERRLAVGLRAEQIAEHLPEAIVLRSGRDRQLARALSPTIQGAISESVRRNPKEIATAIFPVLGPAIRKAIAETMAALVRSINAAVEHSFSIRGLRWRIESWRTGVPFAQIIIKHSLVYRVEQVFLIHAESGLLLAHMAPRDLAVADADLIAGMMIAIQDFVADSFKVEEEGARLRTFSVGEMTVFVERGPLAILAAVVRGQPPETYLRKLQDTLETVHLQFAGLFSGFTGDAKPFQATGPLLEDCLETVLTTDRATANARRALLRWALPALAVLVVLGLLLGRTERNWRTALRTLEGVPGVVVMHADRGWVRWRFFGLRDPVAANPSAVLAAIGVDTATVDGLWRPYLSLEPVIVLERARRALAPPATVRLALLGDSLAARGVASIAWLGTVRARTALPAGVGSLDLSGVEPTLPDSLLALRHQIEDRLVFFAVASADPGPGSSEVLRKIAEAEITLSTAVAADGYQIGLEVVGRTDATGSDSTNRALSRLRAEAVKDRLVREGVAPAEMRPVGVDRSAPLPGKDDADRAARNRSVAFLVHLVVDLPAAKELR